MLRTMVCPSQSCSTLAYHWSYWRLKRCNPSAFILTGMDWHLSVPDVAQQPYFFAINVERYCAVTLRRLCITHVVFAVRIVGRS